MRSLKNLVILRRLVEQFRLTWQLMRDPRTPAWLKWSFIGVLLYVALPLDFVPDFIPILGQLDDIGVILGWMKLIEQLSPAEVLAEAHARLRENWGDGDVIDGSSWHRAEKRKE